MASAARCILASGDSPLTVTSSPPASAAAMKLVAHPASIARGPSLPASRAVGSHPTAHNAMVTPRAKPRNRAYRLLLVVTRAGILGPGVADRGQRLLHHVVEAAHESEDDPA